jgi:hypothetical protein
VQTSVRAPFCILCVTAALGSACVCGPTLASVYEGTTESETSSPSEGGDSLTMTGQRSGSTGDDTDAGDDHDDDHDDEVLRCEERERTDPFWIRGMGTDTEVDAWTVAVAPGLDEETVWLGAINGVVDLGCGPMGGDDLQPVLAKLDRFGNLMWTRSFGDSWTLERSLGTDEAGNIYVLLSHYVWFDDDTVFDGIVLRKLDRDGSLLHDRWFPGRFCYRVAMAVRPDGTAAIGATCDTLDFEIGQVGQGTLYPHIYHAGVLILDPQGEPLQMRELDADWGTFMHDLVWTPGGDLVLSWLAPNADYIWDERADVQNMRVIERWRPSDASVVWERDGEMLGIVAAATGDVVGIEYSQVRSLTRLAHEGGVDLWTHVVPHPELWVDGIACDANGSTIVLGSLFADTELASIELKTANELGEVLLGWFDAEGNLFAHEVWQSDGYAWAVGGFSADDGVLTIAGAYNGLLESPEGHAATPCFKGWNTCGFVGRIQR